MKLIYRSFYTLLFCLMLASCGNGGQQRLLDVASVLFQNGKTEEAMKVYDDIIIAFPNCKEAYFNKGIILYQKIV